MKSTRLASRPQTSISGLSELKTEHANSPSHALTPPSTQRSQSPYPTAEQAPQSLGPPSPHTWPRDYLTPPSETRKRRIEEPSDSLMADTRLSYDSQHARKESFFLSVKNASIANDFSQPGEPPRLTSTPTLSVISDAGNQQHKDLKANKERESHLKDSGDTGLAPSIFTGPGPDRARPCQESPRARFELQLQLRRASQEINSPMHHGHQRDFLPKEKLDELINEASVTRELAARLPSDSPSDYAKLQRVAKAVCTEDKVELGDGKVKIRSYRQIFAVLVFIDRSESIRLFMDDGVSDLDLPLIEHSVPEDPGWNELYLGNSDGNAQGEPLRCSLAWAPETKRQFCQYQWMMLAPFFSLGAYNHVKHYKLKKQHLLPFIRGQQVQGEESRRSQSTEITSGFSQVFRVWIHPDHHNFHDCGPDHRRGFAIKQLRKTDYDVFKQEVDMLKKFSGDGSHDHVVSVLATYEQFGRYHLIFHWADGDLFHYWNQICPIPAFDYATMLWMAKQLYGLADGLLRFHKHDTWSRKVCEGQNQGSNPSDLVEDRNGDGKTRATKRTRFHSPQPPLAQDAESSGSGHGVKRSQYGRHGDLKPENILLFPSPKDERGVLKISDLGQAELHSTRSKTRRESRGINTLTYRPPESDVEPRVVRQSGDIWSLGCIFLEFVTWMLGGMKLVDEFRQQRMSRDPCFPMPMDSDTFYELETVETLRHVGAKLKDSVTRHIETLRSHPNCTEYFKAILNLISNGMLIIEPSENFPPQSRRQSCGEILNCLKDEYEKCQDQRQYAAGVQGWMDIR